jgi:hypothetical protein
MTFARGKMAARKHVRRLYHEDLYRFGAVIILLVHRR